MFLQIPHRLVILRLDTEDVDGSYFTYLSFFLPLYFLCLGKSLNNHLGVSLKVMSIYPKILCLLSKDTL